MILSKIRTRVQQIVCTFLLFIGTFSYTFQADMGKNPFMDLNNLPKNGLMPMPTEQEIQEIEKFLSTLSDSDIEELIKYGESITKIAEENNIPLFFEPTPSTSNLPSTPAVPFSNNEPKKDTDSKNKDKKTTPGLTVTKDDIAYYKKTLDNLLTIIQTIRQRVASAKKLTVTFNSINVELDSLAYYLHVLQRDSIITYLKDKKYENLITLMSNATLQLNDLNNALELPSLEVTYQNPRSPAVQKSIKNAERIVSSIKNYLEKLLNQDSIISLIESLLKEYEPLALQTKQKNEEKEKAAHEFVKKIPVTNTAKQVPPTPTYNQPYQAPRQAPAANQQIKQAQNQQKQKTPDQLQKPNKMVEPLKKPQAPKAKKVTLAELEREIIDAFDSIEQRLVPNRGHINDFLTTYTTSKQEPELISSALNEANFGLKKVKTLVEDWYKKLEKESTSKTDMEKKAKILRDTFKSSSRHNNLKSIHSKTKSVAKTGAEGSVKRFKEMMDGIEKRIVDIF